MSILCHFVRTRKLTLPRMSWNKLSLSGIILITNWLVMELETKPLSFLFLVINIRDGQTSHLDCKMLFTECIWIYIYIYISILCDFKIHRVTILCHPRAKNILKHPNKLPCRPMNRFHFLDNSINWWHHGWGRPHNLCITCNPSRSNFLEQQYNSWDPHHSLQLCFFPSQVTFTCQLLPPGLWKTSG